MKENTKKGVTRREFLGLSALGLASLTILPSWAVNGVRIAPSDRVVLGFVGLGQQGLSDFKSFSTCPGVQVAACCDVDSLKRERFKRRVEAWQKSQNVAPRCDMYEFYDDFIMEDFRIQNRKQSIPEYVASKERCIAILDAIENMPDNWQKVANLKLIQGRPTEEVCQILNISEKACYSRVSRIRKYMETLLGNEMWP